MTTSPFPRYTRFVHDGFPRLRTICQNEGGSSKSRTEVRRPDLFSILSPARQRWPRSPFAYDEWMDGRSPQAVRSILQKFEVHYSAQRLEYKSGRYSLAAQPPPDGYAKPRIILSSLSHWFWQLASTLSYSKSYNIIRC